MNCEDVYNYCMSLPYAEATFPFDASTLVMKIGGRMFALLPLEKADMILAKCDPERAIELRERHHGIMPGWHMNKKHWNMIMLDGSVPETLIRELILHSYSLVAAKLPKATRAALHLNDSDLKELATCTI